MWQGWAASRYRPYRTGERVAAYAARKEISINAAYSLYAHVKHKLDCRSQSDLVLRVFSLNGI